MIKLLPVLAVGIFAPPLIWMAVGGQLIYASQRARRQRLESNTSRLIHAHAAPFAIS